MKEMDNLMKNWQMTPIVILVLTAFMFSLTACQQFGGPRAQAADQLEASPVRRGTMMLATETTGNISSCRDADVSFEISGRVVRVHMQEGDQVQVGQVLMELDTTDLELEIAKARLSLAISKAQLTKLRSGATAMELASAEANLSSARENLARVQEGPTSSQLAAAEAALKAAQDSYQQLLDGPDEDEVTVVKADLRKAEVALERAQADYDKFAWVQGFEASPQAVALHQATIDHERALANYRLKIMDPTEAELQNALAQVARAQDELDRQQDNPTDAEVASAQAQVAQAEVQLDQLTRGAEEEDVAVQEAQVEQAEINLEQASRRLEKARLIAPFSGTVIAVNYEVGDLANPNVAAIALADMSSYEIEVLVDEVDIGGISPGQQVEITLDSYPDVLLAGVVRLIAPKGIVTQGVVNVPVTIKLNPASLPSGPGPNGTGVLLQMTANVRIIQEKREDVLIVPLRAIRREGAREYVLVSNPSGQPRRVEVITGQLDGDQVEITGELRVGEEVLLSEEPARRRSGFSPFGE